MIIIITDSNKSLGSGHLERSLSLLTILLKKGNNALLVLNNSLQKKYPSLHKNFITTVPQKADLIIRDMRDSSVEEIAYLKKKARVLVIDDFGKGRDTANHVLDLLPNPYETTYYHPELFLYGYSFINSLQELKESPPDLKIDIALYPAAMDSGYSNKLIELLSHEKNIAVLKGPKTILKKDKAVIPAGHIPLAKIFLAAGWIITHFGITLYEAHCAGCAPLVINPTRYHDTLTGLAADELSVSLHGLSAEISPETAARHCMTTLQKNTSIDQCLSTAEQKLNSCADYISNLL